MVARRCRATSSKSEMVTAPIMGAWIAGARGARMLCRQILPGEGGSWSRRAEGRPGGRMEAPARCVENALRRREAGGGGTRSGGSVPADDEERAEVLGEDLAVRTDGDRRVGGADREVQEKRAGAQAAALVDDVEVAVLAVGVDHAVAVDRRRVDAPLEAVRM